MTTITRNTLLLQEHRGEEMKTFTVKENDQDEQLGETAEESRSLEAEQLRRLLVVNEDKCPDQDEVGASRVLSEFSHSQDHESPETRQLIKTTRQHPDPDPIGLLSNSTTLTNTTNSETLIVQELQEDFNGNNKQSIKNKIKGANNHLIRSISGCSVSSCYRRGSESSWTGHGTQQSITHTRCSVSESMLALDKSLAGKMRREGDEPLSFQVRWQRLNYTYEPSRLASMLELKSKRAQQVLRNLSGGFKSNQLVALIGPSGCGKTTLLQLLSGNKRAELDKLCITGIEKPRVSFIGQDDVLLSDLTCRETLIYASRLQNTEPQFDHRRHVEPVLRSLGLTECADRSVNKLSGGQIKRVSIAQELLYPTNILILDEITSGLDANTSYSIVSQLKQLTSDSRYPMSIIMSIHQPAARLFAIFDKCYVMSAGRCLYEGSCKVDLINSHLAQFQLECPKFTNVADFLIELASEDPDSENADDSQDSVDPLAMMSTTERMFAYHERQARLRFCSPTKSPTDTLNGSKTTSKNNAIRSAVSNLDKDLGKRSKRTKMNKNSTSSSSISIRMGDEDQVEDHESMKDDEDSMINTDTDTPTKLEHDEDDTTNETCELMKGLDENPQVIVDSQTSSSNNKNHSIAMQMQLHQDQHPDSSLSTTSNSTSKTSKSLYLAIERARAERKKPFFDHFMIHLERSSLRIRRSYILTYMQLITYTFLAFQLVTFFGSDIGKLNGCPSLPMSFIGFVLSDDKEGAGDALMLEIRRIQENCNFLLVAVMTATFAALEITVITFPMEARTVKREWRNGRYTTSSYFMGRTMADLPCQLVCVFVFAIATFSQTGQLGLYSWRFISYFSILFCMAIIAQAVGFLAGAIFMDSLPMAVFFAPLSIFPTLLFSGFFARVNTIPYVYVLVSYLSHFRYGFEALMVTLYGFGRCQCDQVILDQYHTSLKGETATMRDMFKSMLGPQTCNNNNSNQNNNNQNHHSSDQNTINNINNPSAADQDLLNENPGFNILNDTLIDTLTPSTTPALSDLYVPPMFSTSSSSTTERPMKAFEDALLESVYAHMSSTNQSSSSTSDSGMGASGGGGALDMVMDRFAGRMTSMFNARSNYGRPVPLKCEDFNSYLINELGLTDNDLIKGLFALIMMAILSRLICNYLLNVTMRAKVD